MLPSNESVCVSSSISKFEEYHLDGVNQLYDQRVLEKEGGIVLGVFVFTAKCAGVVDSGTRRYDEAEAVNWKRQESENLVLCCE